MLVTKNIAELIGVIIGDGCIVYRPKLGKYCIEIVGDNKRDREYFSYLAYLVFSAIGKYPHIAYRSRGLRLRFYSKEFVAFLTLDLDMAHGKGKGKKVSIPQQIFNSHELLVSCIRGIADSDGTIFLSHKVGCKDPYITIEITTTSKTLAQQLLAALASFGFRVRWRRYHKEGALPIYRISLNGESQACKWFDKIGFSNKRKSSKYLNRF